MVGTENREIRKPNQGVGTARSNRSLAGTFDALLDVLLDVLLIVLFDRLLDIPIPLSAVAATADCSIDATALGSTTRSSQ